MQLAKPALKCLREIAAERWDVVRAVSDPGPESGAYDRYLFEAADRLRDGALDDDIADYFINVATEELGLDTGSGMRARALIFAKAIRECVETTVQVGA